MYGFNRYHYLEQAMKRALLAALAAFSIVLISGVLFGWAYALLIGFILAFMVWTQSAGRRS